ncbi:MAG: hypothetical protein HXS54_03425 [Theionarchaea archaeon]|nr:hypothetical protein [Theionarchaea archaeon]
MAEQKYTLEEFHKKVAIETNNSIWPVLDSKTPTDAQLEEALHVKRIYTEDD